MSGNSQDNDPFPNDASRRRFLRLGLMVPLLGWLPLRALAAETKIALKTPAKPVRPSRPAKPAKKPKPPKAEEKKKASAKKLVPSRKPDVPRLLMIDPGHGGHDPGAISVKGLREKDVTLDLALRIAKILAPLPDIIVKLTRDTDAFLSLKDRVKRGRDEHADLFLSIHADSALDKSARGLSVYTLSEKASDEFSKALAAKENQADVVGGFGFPLDDLEVMNILLDLTTGRARNVAEKAKRGFVKAMKRHCLLLENPMRAANFAVLRSPEVPSMLVETGFLSNPKDEALLTQPKHRQKIALAMAKEVRTLLNGALFG